MNDRLLGMKRILKVQDQVKRIADWRVAEAERSKRQIEEAQRDLAAFIDDGALDGALAAAAVAQTRRLFGRGTAAAETLEAENEKAREAHGRQKLVARFVDALARDDRMARERKELDSLVEAFASRASHAEAEPDPTAR